MRTVETSEWQIPRPWHQVELAGAYVGMAVDAETQVFTPAERSALTLAEATTNLRESARGTAAAAARAELTDEQISAVLWVGISINAFNRVSIMSGHPVKEA